MSTLTKNMQFHHNHRHHIFFFFGRQRVYARSVSPKMWCRLCSNCSSVAFELKRLNPIKCCQCHMQTLKWASNHRSGWATRSFVGVYPQSSSYSNDTCQILQTNIFDAAKKYIILKYFSTSPLSVITKSHCFKNIWNIRYSYLWDAPCARRKFYSKKLKSRNFLAICTSSSVVRSWTQESFGIFLLLSLQHQNLVHVKIIIFAFARRVRYFH